MKTELHGRTSKICYGMDYEHSMAKVCDSTKRGETGGRRREVPRLGIQYITGGRQAYDIK
jgi:hypothetical protein